jgi:hypothetical protein
MHRPKYPAQRAKVSHMHKQMVVIGQNDPSGDRHAMQRELLEECSLHLLTTFSRPHMVDMLIARSGKQIESLVMNWVRWRVGWKSACRPILDDCMTLFRRKFGVVVHCDLVRR